VSLQSGDATSKGAVYRQGVKGATKLTFSLEAELSGWKRWFMGGSVQRTMDAEMAALDTLKAVLEG
jgi:hypothetical protein